MHVRASSAKKNKSAIFTDMETGNPETDKLNSGKRVAIVISEVDYSRHFLWIAEGLKRKNIDLHFIWLFEKEPELHRILSQRGIASNYIPLKSKFGFIQASIRLYFLLRKIKPDILHAHLFNSGRIAIPIGRLLGIKSIYTRHYSTLHHDYFPRAVIQDKWINRLSNMVVAVSAGVAEVLVNKEGLSKNKIRVIPHGFDFAEITPLDSQEKAAARKKAEIPDEATPVIGVVSRFVEWKGIQYILPAFKEFIQSHPNALLVLANATGDYKSELQKWLQLIPVKNIKMIEFQKDQGILFGSFDCFIHVPTDATIEAYGQVYVEALAYQLPCIFTKSGVAAEFAENNENCVIVPYKSSEAISQSLEKIFSDQRFAEKMALMGRQKVLQVYDVESMVNKTAALYGE